MAQNITLLGASYSNVPAVELPKTGGGTASFTDVTDTTALAGDVMQGKYFFTASGQLTLGTNQGGSGDSPTLVTGTFTTGSTRKETGTVAINYSGNGFPIAFMVYPTATINTNNDVGVFSAIKKTSVEPSYTTVADDNNKTTAVYTFYSSGNKAVLPSNSAASYVGSQYVAGAAFNCVKFIGNATTLGYYVGNSTSSTRGLAPGKEYSYMIFYSE